MITLLMYTNTKCTIQESNQYFCKFAIMKNIFLIFIFVGAFAFVQNASPTNLPLKLCSNLNGEAYAKCLKSAGDKLKQLVLKQLNFTTIDPIAIPVFSAQKTINDDTSFEYEIKNASIHGFNGVRFKNLDFNLKTLTAKIGLDVPAVHATSNYGVKGKFQGLPVNLEGTFKGDIQNIDVIFEVHLKAIENKGVKYYTFDNVKVQSTVEDCVINLSSANPKQQMLASYIEMQFNNNSKRIIQYNSPLINDALRRVFEKVIQPMLKSIPATELQSS